MIKTGKYISFIATLLFSVILCIGVSAQEVSVSASLTETNIYSGEMVTLKVSVSGETLNSIERPQMPPVNGLRWLPNNVSSSQSFTYKNGRPNISYSYDYSFIAQDPGSYSFPSLTVHVNNQQFETDIISFKVLDPKDIGSDDADRSPDIYVRLEPSNKNPVVGEQVIADVVLYFKSEVEVSSYQATPGWKAEGFWKEEFETRQQARTTSTIINGIRYQRARLLQYALFPTKTGTLTLSPFDVIVQVRQRNRQRDIFSFGLGSERLELSTLPVEVNVSPLPELNNATFSGGVGKFTITRSIKPSEAYVGESVEIITTISGEGNIPLIVKPEYDYPETLELYNPQESSTINRTNSLISGQKTFTDIVIARNEGTFTIPAQNLAYYNPVSDSYSNIELPALTLTAERDPRAVVPSVNELRLNVEPITGLAKWNPVQKESLTSKSWVWLLLVSPLLVLAVAYGFKTYSDKMSSDTAFARSQKAKDKALAELAIAKDQEDLKQGYYHIQKALIQFISDKLNLPKAGLSTEKIVSALEAKAGRTTALDVKRILDKCDTIAYAPNATQEAMSTDIQKTEELIKNMGKLL